MSPQRWLHLVHAANYPSEREACKINELQFIDLSSVPQSSIAVHHDNYSILFVVMPHSSSSFDANTSPD